MTIVSIEDNLFNQANITIAHGGTVRWTNNGANMQHTVTSNGHAGANFACTPSSTEDFHSGLLAHGATFRSPFPDPRNFRLPLRFPRLHDGRDRNRHVILEDKFWRQVRKELPWRRVTSI